MHKLKSEDSIFIFAFDKTLFLNEKECLNYEYDKLMQKENYRLLCSYVKYSSSIPDDPSIVPSISIRSARLTDEKKYQLLGVKTVFDINGGEERYFGFINDFREEIWFSLTTIERYFEVIPRTQSSFIQKKHTNK